MEINLPDAMQKKGFGDFALHGFTQEMVSDADLSDVVDT